MSKISEIGTRIRLSREQKGLTQKELGELLGCPQTTVASWERQEKIMPRKELIRPIADALNVSEIYLLGFERENTFKIKHLGRFIKNNILKEKQKHIEVTENEYKEDRFSVIVDESSFEPYILQNDYCIFEKSTPKIDDIVLVKIKEEYMIKKWKKTNEFTILIDVMMVQNAPIILEKINGKCEGRLVTLKRYVK